MPEEIEYSFAREVWKRYRSSFSAMFGLTVIIILCLIAVTAPLLANHLPLLVRLNGVLKSPALCELFAPDSTEIFVSKTFNWLLLVLPVVRLYRRKRT